MFPEHIHLTEHAVQRMNQRRLSIDDIIYVLRYGQTIYRAGIAHFFLGRRNIPPQDRSISKISHLIGTTILIESKNLTEVITVYRNRDAIKKIRTKEKFNRKTSRSLFQET
jgi:hypothetical protein